MAQTTQAPTRKEIVKQELATLAFITRGGNWLFLLMSRLAEPFMFFSTLYVIAETVLPGLFKAPAYLQISSVSIIILNIAPEVILPGCFMQAGMAEENRQWMYKAMGCVFIALTFVTLASFIWDFPVGAVSVILFFRCAAGVLYSLLVRMTPQHPEERQATQQVNDLQERFNQQLQHLAQEMTSLQKNMQTSLTANTSELAMTLQTSLTASTSEFATTFQGHLATELATLQAHIQHIEQTTREELRQVKTALDKQAQKTVDEPHRQGERPVLLALPSVQKAKFDARAFVFSCLQQDPTCKLADIEKLAEAQGQEISQSSISRYRTQFFASSESSVMQA